MGGNMKQPQPKREGLTSVQIKPRLARMIQFFIKRGMSKSQLINEALEQYLVDKELQEIRRGLLPFAQAKGIYTDEDVKRTFE